MSTSRRTGSEVWNWPCLCIGSTGRCGLAVERGYRIDTGRRRTSSEEPLANIGVVVKFRKDSCGASTEGKGSALVMAREAIGRSGRSANNRLKRQRRLVGGGFVWGTG